MRTKKRARRAISAARRARDLRVEAEKILREKCDYDRGRAEYKSEIRSSGKTGPIVDPYIRWSKTLNNYIKQCGYFCSWISKNHPEVLSIMDAKPYIAEWLQTLIGEGKSPYTLLTYRAAVVKLYDTPDCRFTVKDIPVSLPKRRADMITRSREAVPSDTHFDETKHADFVEFCRSVGLRRSELENLKPDQLIYHKGQWCIRIRHGDGSKGGRPRIAPIFAKSPDEMEAILDKFAHPASKYVWAEEDDQGNPRSVYGHADIHSYRADYAMRVYTHFARPIDELKRMPPYIRNPRFSAKLPVYKTAAGQYYNLYKTPSGKEKRIYQYYQFNTVIIRGGPYSGKEVDRWAAMLTSRALGHNRISVTTTHYFRR